MQLGQDYFPMTFFLVNRSCNSDGLLRVFVKDTPECSLLLEMFSA